MSKTVVFFGNECIATGTSTNTPVLNALSSAGYNIAAVITPFKTTASRSTQSLEIIKTAANLNIPAFNPLEQPELTSLIKSFNAEIGVLVAYGQIVSQEVLDIFPYGIINLHPSLLPQYRGSTPVETAILEGAGVTGISLMKLVAEMDAGPIYAQDKLPLNGSETKQKLADILLDLGAKKIIEVLPAILSGELKPEEQNSNKATYTQRLSSQSGQINWKQPAVQIERQIRAYALWPKSKTTLGGVEIIVHQAHVVENSGLGTPGTVALDEEQIKVQSSHGQLVIDSLQPVGKAQMDTKSFLAGYKDKLGLI